MYNTFDPMADDFMWIPSVAAIRGNQLLVGDAFPDGDWFSVSL